MVLEFKIEGMTCVACSNAIEKGLTSEFKEKGLVTDSNMENHGVSVVLLMHKMRISFYKSKMESHGITPESIASEVEDLGFGAELMQQFEQRLIDSSRKHDLQGDSIGFENQTDIRNSTFIVKGMTCASCSSSIEKHLTSLAGALEVSVSLLTNKTTIRHDQTLLGARKIIEEISDIGFQAELEPNNKHTDVRVIV